jgi:very-short-patch-repair endonuclease
MIRDARLPAPQVNARVAGDEVDFFWLEQQLIVEIDGYQFHSTRRPFDYDHRKDADLRAAGFVVLRFTYEQLRDEPLAVVAGVTRALATAPQVATISAPSSREMATSTE